jgi:hypothetical protein
MENLEKLATRGTQDEKNKAKTQSNTCWTPEHSKTKQKTQCNTCWIPEHSKTKQTNTTQYVLDTRT